MPIAAIAFDFDPIVRLGDIAVRLETVVVAIGLLCAILLAARLVGRDIRDEDPVPPASLQLRLGDLVFVVLAIIPGAVIGGRLGYALIHLDFYLAHPAALVDPGQGSLELALGVAGGALTGSWAASLLTGPVGGWLHAAALPTLVALAIGKLAMALGGDGQGLPSSLPWATSYVGPGPWGSLAPAIASNPSQLYEAGATVVVLVLVILSMAGGAFGRRDGLALLAALGGWAAARAIVATTWRDATVLGPLRADQLLSLGVVAGCVGAAMIVTRRADDSGPWSIVRSTVAARIGARRGSQQREDQP